LPRQIHRWAALMFVAVCLQHLRLFFTGAFRQRRGLNWLVRVLLLTLGAVAGWTGTPAAVVLRGACGTAPEARG